MFSLLQYDIPKRSRFQNPSRRLRDIAIRTSMSVWVLKNDHIPHSLLARMTAAGVRWHLVPFEASAAPAILAMTTEALRQEVARVEAAVRRSLDRAGDKLEAGDATLRQHQTGTRAALKRAQEALAAAERVAALFGIDANTDSTAAAVQRMGLAARQRAEVYASLAREVAEHDGPLAEAAEADLVPAGILADRIEDETGRDMEAVHAVFRDAQQAVVASAQSEEVAYARALGRHHNVYRNPFPHGSAAALAYHEGFWRDHS